MVYHVGIYGDRIPTAAHRFRLLRSLADLQCLGVFLRFCERMWSIPVVILDLGIGSSLKQEMLRRPPDLAMQHNKEDANLQR